MNQLQPGYSNREWYRCGFTCENCGSIFARLPFRLSGPRWENADDRLLYCLDCP